MKKYKVYLKALTGNRFEIIKIVGRINVPSNNYQSRSSAGDTLTEKEAQYLADAGFYEVTVTK